MRCLRVTNTNPAVKRKKWWQREKGKMHIARLSLIISNFLNKIRKLVLTNQQVLILQNLNIINHSY
jgi:hypothetical protein